MKKTISVLCLISFLFMTGCATLFKGTSENVSMNASPVRAEVFINGQNMGETPLQLKLESKKNYAIEFRAEGYQPRIYNISSKVGAGWIILDVLGGLIPVIIDAATGAWYKLDQNNINAVLEKQQP
ncbi:MAG: PEGA domain-containing protein [Candidatus Aminicenantes bacterium]|nr:PEGA domain-containing protein [Candidatus Aminicenantes bacterium]